MKYWIITHGGYYLGGSSMVRANTKKEAKEKGLAFVKAYYAERGQKVDKIYSVTELTEEFHMIDDGDY